jgi:type IV pilus assembly protein PilN
MRLDINLASQPYEDARQFWMGWGTGVGVLGLITVLLVGTTIAGWFNARRDHAAISQVRQQIAERDARHAEAEATLNQPKNRTTRDESQFLNELIERKSFSWTQVLESMEKVMPPRVHLVNITPASDDENQISLKMTIAGESRERVLELMQRMEESQRFAHTNMTGEAFSPTATGDSEKAEIVALYIPAPPPSESPKSGVQSKADSAAKSTSEKSGTFGAAKPTKNSAKPMTGVSTPPPAKRNQN